MITKHICVSLLGACWLSVFILPLAAVEPTPEQLEFFERNIRPLFVENCYSCHSAKAEKLRGGLRLDTPADFLKGGDSGTVVVPGDPEKSLLIKAVRYQDPELQMPPKNRKLAADQIVMLETWVKAGAAFPSTAGNAPRVSAGSKTRVEHWAFQPVKKPALPTVKRKRWVQNEVDAFVLAKLERKGLKPAPPADRRTLIRRVSYDLIGLPPTPEEADAFLSDKRPDAYSRLVERLLASPQYGERWGRLWLDVARYADTKGYLAGGEERRYAFSYTYRDYVIRAFNDDKPYNDFIIEQIAADLLRGAPTQGPNNPAKSLAGQDAGSSRQDNRALAALGFLTLGRRFLNNQDDIIDDRIDVVTRGTMGLTVACARCHDHKFDPIPTEDYYALHGVFASSEEPGEEPLLGPLGDTPQYQDFLKQKAGVEREIAAFEDKEIAQFLSDLRQNIGDYLLGVRDAKTLADETKFDTFAGERKLNPVVLRRWVANLDTRRKQPDQIFSAWFMLSALPDKDFPTNGASLLAKLEPGLNLAVRAALSNSPPVSVRQLAEVYNRVFKETDAEWRAGQDAAAKEKKPAPSVLLDPARESLRQQLYAGGAPPNLPTDEVRRLHARRLNEGAAPLRNKIDALNWTHPGAPPRAMALLDRAQPHNSHVARRGNPANPGPEVPRRFLSVLRRSGSTPFSNGSGRLELARAIASRDNPLTARVYVNRVWLHHFGEGLVTTPGDFGVRTEAPLQQDLLDYLAATFMEHGWSTKQLHRLLLLSSTYQQSCDADAKGLKMDPDNRLFHHQNRRRLDFEQLRDTLLAVSGKLELTVGGLPVDIVAEPFSSRRSVYGLIDRQNLPGLFRTFDFANPDTSNQRRFATTVPQQSLFMMNSPFVIEQARRLAGRAAGKGTENSAVKIKRLFRLAYQRAPEPDELRGGLRFIASQPASATPLTALQRYAQVLLLSNELMFID